MQELRWAKEDMSNVRVTVSVGTRSSFHANVIILPVYHHFRSRILEMYYIGICVGHVECTRYKENALAYRDTDSHFTFRKSMFSAQLLAEPCILRNCMDISFSRKWQLARLAWLGDLVTPAIQLAWQPLRDLLFDPGDWSGTFVWNVCKHLPDYTASFSWKWYSS